MRFRRRPLAVDLEEWTYYLANGIVYRTHTVITTEEQKEGQITVGFRLGIEKQKPTEERDAQSK